MTYSTHSMAFQPTQVPLGNVLTDWACESHEFAAAWRGRLDDALVAGAIAAVAGGATAGVLGAILKRPLLAAGVGAATAWAAHAVWTAPLVPQPRSPNP